VKRGFTLIELIVVMAVLALLAALLMPAVGRGREGAQGAVCQSNLRQLQAAFTLYLNDHDGRFFPYQEPQPDGATLWYFGLGASGHEGARSLDKSRARLAPYFPHVGEVEVCPSFPYGESLTKRKFEMASYGYGLNAYMLEGTPNWKNAGRPTIFSFNRPANTITWADCAQVNTWQSPASPARPMIEEWYYLDVAPPGKFHFRHHGRVNAAFADGSVRALAPNRLDARCDGMTGFLEPLGQDHYLRPDR